jgi:hypothetical protein
LALVVGGVIGNLLVGTGLSNNYAFAGYIDDVRLYTSALNAHEVAALYSNPALTQSIGVSNSYLPITGYTKPVLPGVTANVVDSKVSQTGQYMVAVTSASDSPLARLTLDNTNVDSQGVLTPATGAGTVTYSSSIKQVGSHSAFFNNTAGSGNNNYLNYTVPSSLYTPSTLTISTWIYPTAIPAAGQSCFFAFNNNISAAGPYIAITDAGILTCAYYTTTSSNNAISSGTVSLNTWSHVSAVYSAGTVSLYLNGILQSTASYTGLLSLNGGGNISNVFLGAVYPSAFAYAGYIDDVRLYTSALSASQVASLYSTNAAINNVFYSTDYGANFSALSIGSSPMTACAISYDGSYLTVANASTVYVLNRNSSTYTLALGNGAGQTNQASNSIAIGNLAGQTNQSANSIVLNASGSALNTGSAGFYVSPVGTTAGLPMDLLGYGADSQIVKTGITVLPGGQVGIGTVTPAAALDVWGSIYSHGGYQKLGAFMKSYVYPGVVGGAVVGVVSSGGTEIPTIYMTDSAYVGIGTTNPQAKLHIVGETQVFQIQNTGTSSNYMLLNTSNNAGRMFIGMDDSNGNGLFGGGSAYMNWIGTATNAPLGFATGNAERMRITGTGNVGIGITNPSATLHVAGTAMASFFNTSNVNYNLTTSAQTIYSISTNTSGFIMIIGVNGAGNSSKYMGWFEWTSGSTNATVTQLVASSGGGTLAVTITGTAIQASIDTGTYTFNVRVLLL